MLLDIRDSFFQPILSGIFIARVTENLDPKNIGRIKVHIDDVLTFDRTQSPWIQPKLSNGVKSVPEIDSYVLVEFEGGSPYFGYYIGIPMGQNNQIFRGSDDESVYNYGGVSFSFNASTGEVVLNTRTGSGFIIDDIGSVYLTASNNLTMQTIDGKLAINLNMENGEISINSNDIFTITTSIYNLNASQVNEVIGTKITTISGNLEESISGNYDNSVGGDSVVSVFGNTERITVLDDVTTVGGTSTTTIGTGEEKTIVTGGSQLEVFQGLIRQRTLLGNVEIHATTGSIDIQAGITATMNASVAVILGEGTSPMILGDVWQGLYSEHTHPTPVGLSGTPTNAIRVIQAMSQKCRLS